MAQDKLEAAKEEFCRRNEEASEQRCCAVLRELWGDTELRMKRGDYMVPGGMRLFQEDLKRVLEEYERRPDKGVKVSRGRGSGCGGNGCASWWYHQAEAVLKEFLRVKGLEMTEMWLDWVDQQCKAVLAEVAAATQTVEKKLEKQLEKQLEEHRQQQRAELTKMRMVKEKVEQRICILEKQQEAMLAEVAAIKKMVEKQLEQQQQKVMLAEVTVAKKVVEKQQEQQQVALAEVTALQEAAEAQLEERWQRWAQQLQEEQNLVLSQRLEVSAVTALSELSGCTVGCGAVSCWQQHAVDAPRRGCGAVAAPRRGCVGPEPTPHPTGARGTAAGGPWVRGGSTAADAGGRPDGALLALHALEIPGQSGCANPDQIGQQRGEQRRLNGLL